MKVNRDEFIEHYDAYPIFRFTPINGPNMLTYQYSSMDRNMFDNVEDLIVYRGEDKEGFHHWISKENLLTAPPVPKPFNTTPKSESINIGDVIKMKYNGMKQKFRVMGPDDVITENSIQAMVHSGGYVPQSYDETLSKFNTNFKFYPSSSIGERVKDGHLHRIYLEMVPF